MLAMLFHSIVHMEKMSGLPGLGHNTHFNLLYIIGIEMDWYDS